MTEIWTKWESQVIDGAYPLRRCLGASNHSAVFLTEIAARNMPNAAIKLVPAYPAQSEVQIARWRSIASLTHPHLVRLFDSGRCRLGDEQFLFVVMEYAEESLDQILPRRALSPDEVREMLRPALDALAFLHGRNLVQGQLKPPNFLVVGDQLKLASDSIRRAGETRTGAATASWYDPPEARQGGMSPAGDLWALGIAIVEALTQRPPQWPDGRTETVSLPIPLPAEFSDIVARCLNRNPAARPTITDLQAQLSGAPAAPQEPARPPARDEVPASRPIWHTRPGVVPMIALVLTALVTAWATTRLFHGHPASQAPAASPTPAALQPTESTAVAAADSKSAAAEVAAAPEQPAKPAPGVALAVLHQEAPEVSQSARASIHGRIKVAVRVTVDRAGNVVDAAPQHRGSSKYFAHVAADAARKWRFSPSDTQNFRNLTVLFEFTRRGSTGHIATPRS